MVILATTLHSSDDKLAEIAKGMNISLVRGSAEDCLSRFAIAIMRHKIDIVVRLTGDNPLVDPRDIDAEIEMCIRQNFDYVDNVRNSGFPIGLCVEVIRSECLMEAFAMAEDAASREHVTPYIIREGSLYRKGTMISSVNLEHIRVTVDTQEDYSLLKKLHPRIEKESNKNVIETLASIYKQEPDIFLSNKHIKQRTINS
jgi:spore coat polysaccharide biosynthesis protein SpsF